MERMASFKVKKAPVTPDTSRTAVSTSDPRSTDGSVIKDGFLRKLKVSFHPFVSII